MPRKPKPFKLLELAKVTDLAPSLPNLLAECASVCFHLNGFGLSLELSVEKNANTYGPFVSTDTVLIERIEVDERMIRTYYDPLDAAEFGACGIAFLLIHKLFKGTVIGQSRKGGGFDYFVQQKGKKVELFQNADRLEISGLLKQDESEFYKRVREKVVQISKSDSSGTGSFVIVVEFSSTKAKAMER